MNKENIRPFAALRPHPNYANSVIAPPYDVLNTEEARKSANGKPYSFLHISKPEIDLSNCTDKYSEEVYQKGAQNFNSLVSKGILLRDPKACYYIYHMKKDNHQQTGIAMISSVDSYNNNVIKKHELTRPIKEQDRVMQIKALSAHTSPVLLTYMKSERIEEILEYLMNDQPEYDLTDSEGVSHSLWVIDDEKQINDLSDEFNSMSSMYIADGHHRSAAGARVAELMPNVEGSKYFLTVAFPHNQMRILPYHRAVKDISFISKNDLLERISLSFDIVESNVAFQPEINFQFGMYAYGCWYKIRAKEEIIPNSDLVDKLDVSLLHQNLIEPILGIADPRTDERIRFVGGIRGLQELEKLVDNGEMDIAFSLKPTRISDLIRVADSGRIMPPKSTWFDPKLVDGLLSYVID